MDGAISQVFKLNISPPLLFAFILRFRDDSSDPAAPPRLPRAAPREFFVLSSSVDPSSFFCDDLLEQPAGDRRESFGLSPDFPEVFTVFLRETTLPNHRYH
jgi:hypothetical protein